MTYRYRVPVRPDVINVSKNLVEIVEQAAVQLRPVGKEFVGLCPFHSETTPSFSVNPEKNVFYCYGCGEGGDAIRFVMKYHGVDFRAALKILNLDSSAAFTHRNDRRAEARLIAAWARGASIKIRERLLEVGTDAYLCRNVLQIDGADVELLREHEADLNREWEILTVLDDDLNIPATALELWRSRTDIDALIARFE